VPDVALHPFEVTRISGRQCGMAQRDFSFRDRGGQEALTLWRASKAVRNVADVCMGRTRVLGQDRRSTNQTKQCQAKSRASD
jgi:hypothetical protein